MANNKKVWVELGTLRVDANDKDYLHIDNSIKILKGRYNKETEAYDDFKEVDLGDYRTVKLLDPKPGIEGLRSGGHIDDSEYDSKMDYLKNKKVVFKLTVPPVND